MSSPRIAFVGTGANGAGIAADLTRAGLDVTWIEQWPDHVAAMRRDGITVVMPDRTEVTAVRPIHLCEVATLHEPFDITFVVVKAYDTRWATELVKPLVAPDGVVVGLQNGMGVDDIADVVGADRTLGSVIEMASNMFDPGITVRQNAPETAWFAVGGITPAGHARSEEVRAVLSHAGTVEISDDIRSSKWMKLVVNSAELVPSAILDLPLHVAVRESGMEALMRGCGREAAEAALASGSQLVPIFGLDDAPTDDPAAYADLLLDVVLERYTFTDTLTTSLQDWRKGRRSEVEEINGLVVRELERVGRPAPHNSLVVRLAREIEQRRRTPGDHNLAELTTPDGVRPLG